MPYFCPSRRAPAALPATASWYTLLPGTFAHAPIDYAGSSLNNNGVVIQTAATQTWIAGSGPIDTAQIKDGTSFTMIVGDKRMAVQSLGNYLSDDNEGYTSGWDHDVMRYTDRQPLPDTLTGPDGNARFGAAHSGVFNAAFADGSVRALNYSINGTLFDRIGQRRDGQPITID